MGEVIDASEEAKLCICGTSLSLDSPLNVCPLKRVVWYGREQTWDA